MKVIFKCRCGCGSVIWEDEDKLWFEQVGVAKVQVHNLKGGDINGRYSIMQPQGAVKVLEWLDAHPDHEDG